MGLDMYLTKKTYVKNWNHTAPEDVVEITITKGGKPMQGINIDRIKFIEEDVMCWRKANQIHNWFVENVQNGEDNCGQYYVSVEQLRELRDICENVLIALNKAKTKKISVEVGWDKDGKRYQDIDVYDSEEVMELLPPSQGFFFGSSEIDEYYKNDIEETLDFLNDELKHESNSDYYYQSSW